MKQFIGYPKIPQFRNVVRDIKGFTEFIGKDDGGEALYDNSRTKPVLNFRGTVKLHGTNASVAFNKKDGMWAQSRTRIITTDNDNFGFATFVDYMSAGFKKVFDIAAYDNCIDLEYDTIILYGEWAGRGIQKGVAISEIDRAFYIFGARVIGPGAKDRWLPIDGLRYKDARIFNVLDFQSYIVEIDFNNPERVQNTLAEITDKVEKECPVAAEFGVSGVGEGVVWTVKYEGTRYQFKVKGEKHSATKVKTLAKVDVEKIADIEKFVEYAVTDSRFEQAMENVFGTEEPDIKKLGQLIKWTVDDILAEETDTLEENGLNAKDIGKYVAGAVKSRFFELV